MKYYYGTVGSPCSPLLCVVNKSSAVTNIEFTDSSAEIGIRERLEGLGHTVKRNLRRTRKVRRQLERYFAGKLFEFDLELAPEGSDFQLQVWRALQDIPYGETSTYGEIADSMGKPSATRAVGGANGSNPIPIVIPCHRVIGSDGSLTGFGGGLAAKKLLLLLEARYRPHPKKGQLDLDFD